MTAGYQPLIYGPASVSPKEFDRRDLSGTLIKDDFILNAGHLYIHECKYNVTEAPQAQYIVKYYSYEWLLTSNSSKVNTKQNKLTFFFSLCILQKSCTLIEAFISGKLHTRSIVQLSPESNFLFVERISFSWLQESGKRRSWIKTRPDLNNCGLSCLLYTQFDIFQANNSKDVFHR